MNFNRKNRYFTRKYSISPRRISTTNISRKNKIQRVLFDNALLGLGILQKKKNEIGLWENRICSQFYHFSGFSFV